MRPMPLTLLAVTAVYFAARAADAPARSSPVSAAALIAATEAPRPTPPEEWKGLDASVPIDDQRVWKAKPAAEFTIGTHRAISERSRRCSEELIRAQYRQDILKQFAAEAHFDNCAVGPSLDQIAAEVRAIDELLANRPDPERAAHDAMARLGRVAHAVQDFYAHTNWVELQHAHEAAFAPGALVVAVWVEEGRARVKAERELRSGSVLWNGPKLCAQPGAKSHAEMNKDAPDSPAGRARLARWNRSAYAAALELAQHATGKLFAWSYQRWPLLPQQCGDELYLVVGEDRRP